MIEIKLALESPVNGLDTRARMRHQLKLQLQSIEGVSVRDPENPEYQERNPIFDLVLLSGSVGAAYHAMRLARKAIRRRGNRMLLSSEGLEPLELPGASDEEVVAWLMMIKGEGELPE